MAQLKRIRGMMEQRWSSERENRKEESRDDKEGSENSSRKNQKEETPSSASC